MPLSYHKTKVPHARYNRRFIRMPRRFFTGLLSSGNRLSAHGEPPRRDASTGRRLSAMIQDEPAPFPSKPARRRGDSLAAGCSSAWLERTVRDREVDSSNLSTPTSPLFARRSPPLSVIPLLDSSSEFRYLSFYRADLQRRLPGRCGVAGAFYHDFFRNTQVRRKMAELR